jgi:N-methylhydantoinase A
MVYGYHRPGAELEIVNLRIRAIGCVHPPEIPPINLVETDPYAAFIGFHNIVFPSMNQDVPFYHGEVLKPGNRISGPAVIVREDTTILLECGDKGEIDSFNNLTIEIKNKD